MADPRIFINIIEFSIIKKDAKIITRNFPILHFELDTCVNRFYHLFDEMVEYQVFTFAKMVKRSL